MSRPVHKSLLSSQVDPGNLLHQFFGFIDPISHQS